jgi:tripartite-type tricarboxylate transporter receptor subunit TctC
MPGPNRRQMMLTGLASALPFGRARAASYPERPIRMIVPYAAGGAGDNVIRLLSGPMEAKLGQRLVIESMPGAGGNIGAQAVVNAEPNGYTLLVGATNNFVVNQFLFTKMTFDPLEALAPITRLADVPSVLYSNPMVPAKTLSEFIEHARRNPGKLNYGSPSFGTTPHLSVERLKQLTGIDLVHIPYRGAQPALQALLTNDIQLYLGGVTLGRGHLEAGTLRALAVGTQTRLDALPDIPTAMESGVPGYTAANWWGLAAPKGTPPAILDTLYAAVVDALRDGDVRKRFADLGLLPGGEPPAAFAAAMRREAKEWAETIERGKIKME